MHGAYKCKRPPLRRLLSWTTLDGVSHSVAWSSAPKFNAEMMIMDDREEAIRALAHEMWMKAGCPEANAEGFWYAAEGMLAERKSKEASRSEAEASSLVSVGALVVH